MAFLTLDTTNQEYIGTALTIRGRNPTILVLNVGTGPAIASNTTGANRIEGSSSAVGYAGVSGTGDGVQGIGNPGVLGYGAVTNAQGVATGVQGLLTSRGGAGTYLIGVRRRDVNAPRFKRVRLPILPKFTRPPKPTPRQVPRPALSPELKKLLSRMGGQKSPAGKRGTRRSLTP